MNAMVSPGDTAISLHILQPPWGGGQRSDLDSGKKIGVWKFGGGDVLPNVRFGLREENWSLEIGGGCSAKGQIWTRGRKFEFGNFRGVFCQRSDLDSRKKIGVWKFWGEGVFCQRSDLDSEKKIGVWQWGGILPKFRFGLREENWSLKIGGGGVLYQISE